MDDPVYKGNFVNCEVAQMYIDEYYSDAPYTICLHESYIVLPKHIVKKDVNYVRER
jgi:hypothetical protein